MNARHVTCHTRNKLEASSLRDRFSKKDRGQVEEDLTPIRQIDFRSNGCLEVKPQAHLDVPGRVELAAHHAEVMRVREVSTWFEGVVLTSAKHRMIEGVNELHVEARRKSLCDARCLGQRKVHVPAEETTDGSHSETFVIESRIPELRRNQRWVRIRIRNAAR